MLPGLLRASVLPTLALPFPPAIPRSLARSFSVHLSLPVSVSVVPSPSLYSLILLVCEDARVFIQCQRQGSFAVCSRHLANCCRGSARSQHLGQGSHESCCFSRRQAVCAARPRPPEMQPFVFPQSLQKLGKPANLGFTPPHYLL